MLFIIHYSYYPDAASTNRILSYLSGLSKNNLPTTVFFLVPDNKKNKMNKVFDNIEIEYCWDKYYLQGILRFISIFLYLYKIKKRVIKGDIVYAYNVPWFLTLFKKDGVKIYSEKTEHPSCALSGGRFLQTSLKKHIKICKKLNGLFVISSSLKNYYCEQGLDNSKIHILNMTVDTARFYGLKKQKKFNRCVVYCGHGTNNKDGVDILIKSFKIVVSKYPDFKLHIIGAKPSRGDASGNLELVEQLELNNHVIFDGLKSASDIPQILVNADILALARPDSLQAQNGFPTKLGEYLLSKNPVVITNVGDIPLFLKNEESAMIAMNNDVNDFASKLIWLIENPEQAKKIGEKGADIANQFFKAEYITKKMIIHMGLEI